MTTTSTSNAVYLDLDAIVPEKQVVVILDKEEHPLVPVTLEHFVKNMQVMEKIGTGSLTASEEKTMIVDMLDQVLPSIGLPRLNKLTLPQLNTLINFARDHNGEKKVEQEALAEAAAGAAANPQ